MNATPFIALDNYKFCFSEFSEMLTTAETKGRTILDNLLLKFEEQNKNSIPFLKKTKIRISSIASTALCNTKCKFVC